MFDISIESSTTQDGPVFLLVRLLFISSSSPANDRINLKPLKKVPYSFK